MVSGHNKAGGIRPEVVKRVLIYGALILILSAAECSFFSRLKPFGVTPDLILGAVVSVVLLDRQHSAVFAIAAGYTVDAVGSSGFSLSPLFYFAVAVLLSLLAEKMIDSFLSYAVLLIPALIADGAYTYLSFALHYGEFPESSVLGDVILPAMLASAVFCLPLFFLIRLCSKPIETKGKFTF